MPSSTITTEGRSVVGSHPGSAVSDGDIPKYAQKWRGGRFPVKRLVSSRIRLSQINEAMDEPADGKAIRRVILFDEES